MPTTAEHLERANVAKPTLAALTRVFAPFGVLSFGGPALLLSRLRLGLMPVLCFCAVAGLALRLSGLA